MTRSWETVRAEGRLRDRHDDRHRTLKRAGIRLIPFVQAGNVRGTRRNSAACASHVGTAHERLADQNGVHPASAHTAAVFGGADAAFADH